MPSDDNAAWRCTVCGYVHRGAEAPEFCPVCGAARADFEAHEDAPAAHGVQDARRWRCMDCGYVYEGDEPPEFCPVCGAGRDRFEPVKEAAAPGGAASGELRVVILGAGIAGVSAAEAVREASPLSSIKVVAGESRLPYYRLNLTRYLAGEIAGDALPIHPESWYIEKRIGLVLGGEATGISTPDQTVTLADGSDIAFDRLILALGSHPFVPPIPGAQQEGVATLRTAADAEKILRRTEETRSCVCIGGGILGLEIAGALAKRGVDVTVLESHSWLMPRQLNRDAGGVLESHIGDLGVKLRKNARTLEIRDGDDGKEVALQDGETLSCGLVILATGVRPNTYLARKAGLEVNRGILVDNHLRTSAPGIYAAGDVAEHNGVVYGVWGPSQYQGSIAGLNAVGVQTPFGGLPRSNALKVLGLDMLSIGQFEPEDGSFIVVQEQDGSAFRHFVFHDGRMVGAILLSDASAGPFVKKAVEDGRDFSGVLSKGATCAAVLESLT